MLTIPETALGDRNDQGRYAVRVLRPDNTVETRDVLTGLSDSVNIQVVEGLAEGDRVILGEADADAVVEQESKRHGPPMGCVAMALLHIENLRKEYPAGDGTPGGAQGPEPEHRGRGKWWPLSALPARASPRS